MIRKLTLPLLLLATLALPLAHSNHPTPAKGAGGACPDWTIYLPDDDTGPVYVMIDEVFTGFLLGIWVYGESNGRPGLQRHDDYCYTPGYNDDSLRDTIIF